MHNDKNLIHCNCTIGKILDHSDSVTVSMIGNNKPYAAAAHFVHDSKIHKVKRLYILCSSTSPELDYISKSPDVFFNTSFVEMTSPSIAGFISETSLFIVSGEGKANVMTDSDKITKASSMLMEKHSPDKEGDAPATLKNYRINDLLSKGLENSALVSIDISKIIGRKVSSMVK